MEENLFNICICLLVKSSPDFNVFIIFYSYFYFFIFVRYPQSNIFFRMSVNFQFREDGKLLGDIDLKWEQRGGRDARQVFPAVKFHLYLLV